MTHITDDYRKPVIEPASPEETAMINKRVREYEKDQSSFVPRRKRKKTHDSYSTKKESAGIH